MNPTTYSTSSSHERARLRVVYALLGTVFFMPLNLFAMEAFFIAAVLQAVWYLWRHNELIFVRTALFIPAAGFTLTALLSLVGSPHILMGTAFYAFTVLQYFLLYTMTAFFIRGERERRLVLFFMLMSAFCVALYGLYQYAHMLILHNKEWVDHSAFPLLRRRMYSTLYNPNLLSAFMLMLMGLAASLTLGTRHAWHRGLYLGLLFLLTLCLILTYSRGAWISVCALVFFFGLVWDKRVWLLLLLLPGILFFYHGGVADRLLSIFSHSGADTSVSMRLDMWTAAVSMIADHPFLGIGWGAFKYVYPVYNELIQQAGITIFHAHNMFLNIFAETGILGFFFFMWFFFGNAWHALRFLRYVKESAFDRSVAMSMAAAVVSITISGMSDYDLFSTQISLTFWLLCGIFANMSLEYQKNVKKSLRNNSQ
ncbi:polymerase [Megasphaera cerevisiae DSM 20462]|uniref:Polymerase n=1 Tax=Megasphaera cerevisiae DSM 20462 TaxID=1122219 RepID=A0A0J6WXS8_9FIRM|nr:O-antigen ligase family protein [Megasphaera cerevisiae]KMO87013.1 polymerase [Megasphaera cerevisiae DSM 20462]MCI1750551.1 O-antigen ligase family protein [Megasphaera cerevisiae]SJZ81969.1 O-antigen ligase [Megasphaera cerevisiae DSM 20462]